MQPTIETIQGELLALRCAVAALISSLPLSHQLRAWPAFVHNMELVREQLDKNAAEGFDRACVSLKAMRPEGRFGKAPHASGQ